MISVNEAEELVLKYALAPQIVSTKIEDLFEGVLQENLNADRDSPPFHRVAMDGIAIRYKYWESGQLSFTIEGCQQAGQSPLILRNPSNCIEVMTGTVLPDGCDAVVRYEDLEIKNTVATINEKSKLNLMSNVHQKASDYKNGDPLLSSGDMMLAPHWSIAASIGASHIKLARPPKIAIISTGNELVPVATPPLPHQIRLSNVYALLASLRSAGFHDTSLFHIGDNKNEIIRKLDKVIYEHQIVILSGGVSKGKFDFVPEALADLKVKNIFHKIKQKPGKPLWFGAKDNHTLVFGLPGNPISALVCFHRYVLPALWKSIGLKNHNKVYALLNQDIQFETDLTHFIPVEVIFSEKGSLLARPIANNGSGDYASLAKSSGFLELPPKPNKFEADKAYPLYFWSRNL